MQWSLFISCSKFDYHLFDESPEWVLFWYKSVLIRKLRLIVLCAMYMVHFSICNYWLELVELLLRNFTCIWKLFYTYINYPKGVFMFSWENHSKQFSVALLSRFRTHPISTENVQFFFSLLSCSLIFTTSKSCRFATFGALVLLEVPLNLWRVCINVNHSLRGYPGFVLK